MQINVPFYVVFLVLKNCLFKTASNLRMYLVIKDSQMFSLKGWMDEL